MAYRNSPAKSASTQQPVQFRTINDNELKDYSCGICLNVLERPYTPNVCKNHTFCRECLHNSFGQKKCCPLCSKAFTFKDAQYCYQLEKEMKTLRYQCDECSQLVSCLWCCQDTLTLP